MIFSKQDSRGTTTPQRQPQHICGIRITVCTGMLVIMWLSGCATSTETEKSQVEESTKESPSQAEQPNPEKVFVVRTLMNTKNPKPGKLKWKFRTGDWVYSSPAIANDGTIYVGSNDKHLYAFTPNGRLKWRSKTGDWIYSSPAIAKDGTIYVGSTDKHLYAFTPNGNLKWKYQTDNWITSSPTVANDGTIYVGSYDKHLYAFTPNGNLKWRFKTGDDIWSSPAIANDGTIYVGSFDNHLYAITPNGKLKWKFKTGDDIWSSPAIANDGIIYIGSDDNYLYAITPNGNLKWKFETGGFVRSSIAIVKDGTIYVGSYDNHLYAFTPNGNLKWKFETGDWIWSSPTIAHDGTIYVGSLDKHLYAITPNGNLKWRFATDDKISSRPAIANDGTIYVGSADMLLYALYENAPVVHTEYPASEYQQDLNSLKYPIKIRYGSEEEQLTIASKKEFLETEWPFMISTVTGLIPTEPDITKDLVIENSAKKWIFQNTVTPFPREVRIGSGTPNPYQWLLAFYPYAHKPKHGQDALASLEDYVQQSLNAFLLLADVPPPPSKVPQPSLPPAPELVQGQFESDHLFEERIKNTREDHLIQIHRIRTDYASRVKQRNAELDEYASFREARKHYLEPMKAALIGAVLPAVLGSMRTHNPQYDRTSGRLALTVYSDRTNYNERIVADLFNAPPELVEKIYRNPQLLKPALTFALKPDGFNIQDASFSFQNKQYAALPAGEETFDVADNTQPPRRVTLTVTVQDDALDQADYSQKQSTVLEGLNQGVTVRYNDGRIKNLLGDPELTRRVAQLPAEKTNPKRHLLVIGIENYANDNPVPYARQSAQLLADLMTRRFGIPDENRHLMPDATGTAIEGKLRNLLAQVERGDTLYLYYAGHGLPGATGVYMVPADVQRGAYKDEDFNFAQIVEKINNSDLGHTFVFLDTCFSGTGSRVLEGTAPILPEQDLRIPSKMTVFYAGTNQQFANAYDEKGHRLFGYFLAEALLAGKNKANTINDYVRERVRSVSAKKGADLVQTPYFEGRDISLY